MTAVNMEVSMIDGFGGHSDRNQLLNYIRKVTPKPKRIVFTHGQIQKSEALAEIVHQRQKIQSAVVQNRESIRLG